MVLQDLLYFSSLFTQKLGATSTTLGAAKGALQLTHHMSEHLHPPSCLESSQDGRKRCGNDLILDSIACGSEFIFSQS